MDNARFSPRIGHAEGMGKKRLIPLAVLLVAVLYQCFLGCWAWSASQLPDHVATHFNGSGEPNGWMSRPANQRFMLVFGFAFPLFVVLLCYLARFLSSGLVNLPRRDYWLAPERRKGTSDYLVRHSLWFACHRAVENRPLQGA
jgi:hypothetical protein